MWLLTDIGLTKSFVRLSSWASMSVISRPWAAAPVTTLPSMMQLTAQFVWPVMTTSTSSLMRVDDRREAPVGLTQLLIRVGSAPAPLPAVVVLPPSWRRTTMASTPLLLEDRDERVDRSRLVEEVDGRDAVGADDRPACPRGSSR